MQQKKNLILTLGGMRSGKTAWAESRALAITTAAKPFYLATGVAVDDAMEARIQKHRASRSPDFITMEEAHDVAGRIAGCKAGEVMLVDSIGGWLTNRMMAGADLQAEADALLAAIAACPASLIFVSEEVGLGVIPDNAMARDFADTIGGINRRIASLADEVCLLVAGIATRIK